MSYLDTLTQVIEYPLAVLRSVLPFSGGVIVLFMAIGMLVVVLGLHSNRVLIVVSLGCYTSMHLNSSMFSRVDMRPVALLLVVLLALARSRKPTIGILRQGAIPATLAYVLIGLMTLPLAVDPGSTVGTLVSVLAAVLFVTLLVSAATPDEIRSGVHTVTGTVVIVSIVAALALPGDAVEGLRWRGIVDNANSLGLAAGFFFLTARPDRAKLALIPTVIVLLGSASRASTFGIALVAGPALLQRYSPLVRRTVGGAALIAAVPLLHSVFFGAGDTSGTTPGLARTNNSRSDFWGEAVHQISLEPFTGVGPGNSPMLVPSSALRPLVEIGLLGLVPLAILLATTVLVLRADRSVMRNVYLFLFINGAFEGWLFAGGSLFFILFLLASVLVTTSRRGRGWEDTGEKQPASAVLV